MNEARKARYEISFAFVSQEKVSLQSMRETRCL